MRQFSSSGARGVTARTAARTARTLSARTLRTAALVALSATIGMAGSADAQAPLDETCVITFDLQTGQNINNLDFEVDYSGAAGEIEGEGSGATCIRGIGGSFAAFNNKQDEERLVAAVIRLDPFDAPGRLGSCRFHFIGAPPVPQHFAITVTNAGRTGSDTPIRPTPEVTLGTITCPGELTQPTTTTTTFTTTSTSTTITIAGERCGFPASSGDDPTATDALFTLKAAVNQISCRECVCDTDGNGNVTATDALVVLKIAVGGDFPLSCPACD